MISIGAAWILIVDFFIGNRIQEEYFATVILVAAPLSLAILLAVWAQAANNGSSWNSLYPGSVMAAGIGIVVFTVMDLINGIANEFSQSGEFYEITLYIAAAVILFGMVQIRQSDT